MKALKEAPARSESNPQPKQRKKDSSVNVKQPSLRDNDGEGAFSVGDQIGDQLAGLFGDND